MPQTKSSTLPHWDMTTIYPGLDSAEFTADFERLGALLDGLDQYFTGLDETAGADADRLAQSAGELIERLNPAISLAITLRVFLNGFTAVDSYNTEARRLESRQHHSAKPA